MNARDILVARLRGLILKLSEPECAALALLIERGHGPDDPALDLGQIAPAGVFDGVQLVSADNPDNAPQPMQPAPTLDGILSGNGILGAPPTEDTPTEDTPTEDAPTEPPHRPWRNLKEKRQAQAPAVVSA